jgi:hypothetical protein
VARTAEHAHEVSVHATRRRRPSFSWARLAVAVGFAWLVAVWVSRPWVSGDTPFVLDGTNALIDCLSRGDLVGCGHWGYLNDWGLTGLIGDWPLLQYVPDLIAVELGVTSHPDRTRILALLSVAGVVGSVILARVVLSRVGQAAWFWGFLFIALSGPAIAYARTTWGEMLATGLLVALVAATLVPARPPVVALAVLGACLTKETVYPFVVALGLLGLVLARRRTGMSVRPHIVWGGAGLAGGVVLASLFNVVRFGSVLNTNYLEPTLHTPGIGRKLEYTLAVLVAPNGGVFTFWPAAGIVLVAACLLPLLLRSRGAVDTRPAILLAVVILALAVGFASWWTPFGWSGYGPRLFSPWILPLVLVALVAYGEPLREPTRRLLAPLWRSLLVLAIVLAFALPHVGYMWRPESIGGFFRQENPPCTAPWRGDAQRWYACQHQQMWFGRPMLFYALEGVATAGGAVTSIALAGALLGCLLTLRQELERPRFNPTASTTPLPSAASRPIR